MSDSEMPSRKTLAVALDACAARADMIDKEPATAKQCWFLAGLILDGGWVADARDAFDSNTVLTKREASRRIEFYLEQKDAE